MYLREEKESWLKDALEKIQATEHEVIWVGGWAGREQGPQKRHTSSHVRPAMFVWVLLGMCE